MTKKSQLKSILPAVFALQISGIIPPFCAILRMCTMICRKLEMTGPGNGLIITLLSGNCPTADSK
jgi:hypothetical protein